MIQRMTEETRSTRGRIESLRRPSFVHASNLFEKENPIRSSSSHLLSPSSSGTLPIASPSSSSSSSNIQSNIATNKSFSFLINDKVTSTTTRRVTDRKSSTTSLDTLNGTTYLRDFIKLLKDLDDKLSRKIIDRGTLIEVCSLLKIYGSSIDTPELTESAEAEKYNQELAEESKSESQQLLNHFFHQLKQLIKENQLDVVTKGHVLHVIELRSKKWLTNNNVINNVNQLPIAFPNNEKVRDDKKMSEQSDQQSNLINYDHVHPRDYVTEDFLIRNCDTSKVMGFKGVRTKVIEEISKTCITFPKAKKRDVVRRIQITGPDRSCIQKAKELIGEAIRRHSTPFEDVGGTALAAVTTIFCSALFKTSYVAWGNLLDDD